MVATNYTNTFGGENVSPSNLSYVEYTISGNIELKWAFEAVSTDYVTADKIGIDCTVANVMVMMPPANQVTVGQDALFDGIGAQPYIVTDHIGNTLCTVTSGTQWFIYLVDNTTIPGEWRAVQFASTISTVAASALAGAGLRANGTKLDQNLPTTELVAGYTLTAADRATVIKNNGGGVTYTFPDAAAVGNGWFVYISNLGGGNIVLQPVGGDTIDEAANKTLAPGESLIALSDGVNFESVGYGRSVVTAVTGTAVNAAGTGTLALTPTQVAAQIQDFTGTLTGNRRIEYGGSLGYWFVYNKTDPVTPYTMTFAVNAIDPGVVVPQGVLPAGKLSIIRSNGTNMAVAFSESGGTVTSVATTANMTGGPITTTGTLDLSNTGVVANTYGASGTPIRMPVVTVDGKGRITAASTINLGSSTGIDVGTLPGQIPILDAGGNIPSLNGGMQPGDIQYSIALTKPGFVFANGTTIGSATSGASQRANPDTVNLFAVIWSLSNTLFPIYTNLGVLSTRGADATTDFNANKRITVPDLRGTVVAGLDNAGGGANAGRLSTVMGGSSSVIGGAISNNGQATASTTIASSGTNRINYGAIALADGQASGPNIISSSPAGAGQDSMASGATLSVTGTTTPDASFGITVSGSGVSTAFTIAQSTMVMNPFLKL